MHAARLVHRSPATGCVCCTFGMPWVVQSSSTGITLHAPHNAADVGKGILAVEAKIPSHMQTWDSAQRSGLLTLAQTVPKPAVAAAVLKCMSDALKPGTLVRGVLRCCPAAAWNRVVRHGGVGSSSSCVCVSRVHVLFCYTWSNMCATPTAWDGLGQQHGPLGSASGWAAYEAELWTFIPAELQAAFRNADSAHRQHEGLETLWALLVELHKSLNGVPGVFQV